MFSLMRYIFWKLPVEMEGCVLTGYSLNAGGYHFTYDCKGT